MNADAMNPQKNNPASKKAQFQTFGRPRPARTIGFELNWPLVVDSIPSYCLGKVRERIADERTIAYP
jgi:hypothetical protein